jgi:hypothetical protein
LRDLEKSLEKDKKRFCLGAFYSTSLGGSFLNIVRAIIAVIVLVLATIILTSNDYSKSNTIMPYMLICLGVLQVLNGMEFFKHDKKIQSILMFIFSIFIFGFVVKIYIL